jgi:hypothetical protein
VLGEDHPSTLTSRNNLAGVYGVSGDVVRAIPLFERTLEDRVRVLGEDHPDTLASRNNLAGAIFGRSGDVVRAIPLYEQALAGCLRALGEDHPTTKTVLANLSAARAQQSLTYAPTSSSTAPNRPASTNGAVTVGSLYHRNGHVFP